jgi:hypothetical protein
LCVCCGYHVTATDPSPSNGCLSWLHNSGFQQTCSNVYIYATHVYSVWSRQWHFPTLWRPRIYITSGRYMEGWLQIGGLASRSTVISSDEKMHASCRLRDSKLRPHGFHWPQLPDRLCKYIWDTANSSFWSSAMKPQLEALNNLASKVKTHVTLNGSLLFAFNLGNHPPFRPLWVWFPARRNHSAVSNYVFTCVTSPCKIWRRERRRLVSSRAARQNCLCVTSVFRVRRIEYWGFSNVSANPEVTIFMVNDFGWGGEQCVGSRAVTGWTQDGDANQQGETMWLNKRC